MAQSAAHRGSRYRRVMLDYLLAADLLTLTVCQALLVWHCFKAGPKASLFAGFVTERAEHLSDTLVEYGAILEDIADSIDGHPGGGSGPTPSAPAGGLQEILLSGLLNRMMTGGAHGQENPLREIPEENTTSAEIRDEPPESG